MVHRVSRVSVLVLFALVLAATAGAAAEQPPVVHHDVRVSFDPDSHAVRIDDTATVPAGLDTFELAEGFREVTVARQILAGAPAGTDAVDSTLGESRTFVLPPVAAAGGEVAFAYHARVEQPTDRVRFSRENVGGEIGGTVGQEGIYLSGSLPWLPMFAGALNTFRVTVEVPAGWLPVTQGDLASENERDGRRITVFEQPHPTDGITLIANRFIRAERKVGANDHVTARTYLLEDDPDLRDLYLERTAYYIDMYEAMIGPYPYGKFATVENWFPTGYGMPGWTLLGGQVLRLPFIPYTSFGHEIAHNWWGNAVFVDAERGNWCEGLTSWCADYHYKELESAEAAREYRRNLLKDYEAYVGQDPGQDFPLTAFKSRHSGATRAVGYGKSMMVFHMLDTRLGRDHFLQALRTVYDGFRYQAATWDDFIGAMEVSGGVGLDQFAEQWLTRTGAPTLTLEHAERDGDQVRFTLTQAGPAYRLHVPVVATVPGGDVRAVVELDQAREAFTISAPGATQLAVDPDYDLFRHLHPAEVEPTLSRVLAAEAPDFVPPAGAGTVAADAVAGFAAGFTEDDEPSVLAGGAAPHAGVTAVLVNPPAEVLRGYLPRELQIVGDLVFIAGKRSSLKDSDLVFAAYRPGETGTTDLIVLTRDPSRLPGLGSRLGHYGKYSWLLLPAGGGRPERGNWAPAGNPLVSELDS